MQQRYDWSIFQDCGVWVGGRWSFQVGAAGTVTGEEMHWYRERAKLKYHGGLHVWTRGYLQRCMGTLKKNM